MLITTGPCQVLFRGSYSRENDRDPIRYSSGNLVEFVKLMDPETGDIFDYTLADGINGQVKVGDVLSLTVEQRCEMVSGVSKSGRSYVTHKFKHKVLDAQRSAQPSDAKAAA